MALCSRGGLRGRGHGARPTDPRVVWRATGARGMSRERSTSGVGAAAVGEHAATSSRLFDVGIVGVGSMGIAITERLTAQGYSVIGYRRGSLDSFKAVGGRAAENAAAVASQTDVVLLLLPDDAALLQVMADITPSLRVGKLVILLASHRIDDKIKAAAIGEAAGACVLDGEISGTADMVRAGQASVMIAGDPEGVSQARPALQAFAPAVVELSPFGAATNMKLVTNYLVGVHTLAAAEAMLLGTSLGLEASDIVRAIGPSAGSSRMFVVRGAMMARDAFPSGDMPAFLRYFELLRHALGTEQADGWPVLTLTESLYRAAIEEGHGRRDIAAIYDSLKGKRPD